MKNNYTLMIAIFGLFVIALAVGVLIYRFVRSKKKIRKGLTVIIGIVSGLVVLAVPLGILLGMFESDSFFNRAYEEDLYINIPDTDARLLIREWSWGLGCGAEVYYVPANGKNRQLGFCAGDDGDPLFSDGKYTVTFLDGNKVLLEWDVEGRWATEEFSFDKYVT